MVRIGNDAFCDFGEALPWFFDVLSERKAFIYALEILAQVLAITTFSNRLPTWWTAYIDNTTGKCALTKGYGSSGAVNGMVATVWGMAAANGWAPHFDRGLSSDNIADALSKGDDTEAQRMGWTRVHTRQDESTTPACPRSMPRRRRLSSRSTSPPQCHGRVQNAPPPRLSRRWIRVGFACK